MLPVVEASRDVSIDLDRLADHAGWMAYEELPPPAFILPFPLELDRDGIVDFVLTATCINFAFTDFATRERWEVVHDGRVLADADGMHFCIQRALAEDVPVLDGAWLAEVTEDDLRGIFRGGNVGAAAPRRAGQDLARGRRDARRALRRPVLERLRLGAAPATTRRFLERLTRDFPRFDDTADVRRRDRALLEARAALGLDPAGDAARAAPGSRTSTA